MEYRIQKDFYPHDNQFHYHMMNNKWINQWTVVNKSDKGTTNKSNYKTKYIERKLIFSAFSVSRVCSIGFTDPAFSNPENSPNPANSPNSDLDFPLKVEDIAARPK